MFDKIRVTYDDTERTYNFKAYLGFNINKALFKIISKNKKEALFDSFGVIGFKTHRYFMLEVYEVVKILMRSRFRYGLNIKAMQNILTYIENNIFHVERDYRYNLNYNKIKEKMNFKILDHQKKAYVDYETFKNRLGYRGFLLDAGAGMGKTFMSLSLAEAIESNKVIIVSPIEAIERVWIESLTGEMYKSKQSYYTTYNSNSRYQNEKFIIVHYEALEWLLEHKDDLKTNNLTIIVDEIHNFNEKTSKRHQQLTKFVNDIEPDDLIIMSGTTIKAVSSELVLMQRLLDKDFDNAIEKRFMKLYKNPGKVFKPILTKRYGEYSSRIEKESLGLDKPVTNYIPIKLKNGKKYTLSNIRKKVEKFVKERLEEIDDNQDYYLQRYDKIYTITKTTLITKGVDRDKFVTYEREFKEIRDKYRTSKIVYDTDLLKRVNSFEKNVLMPEMSKEEKKEFKELKSILKYPVLKVQGEALAKVVMKERINCHRDMASVIKYADIINTGEKKTVVFSNNIEVCDMAYSKISDLGFKPIRVYGDTKKDLGKNVAAFFNNKEINPLVTTYKSLSTAVPLIAANVNIIIDLPFRSYIYEQAIARTWRSGQDEIVYIYIMELDTKDEPNLNSRNIDIIKYFKNEVEDITGYKMNIDLEGEKDISNEGMDIFYHPKERNTIINSWLDI